MAGTKSDPRMLLSKDMSHFCPTLAQQATRRFDGYNPYRAGFFPETICINSSYSKEPDWSASACNNDENIRIYKKY